MADRIEFPQVFTLLDAEEETGAGDAVFCVPANPGVQTKKTFVASIASVGAATATVLIEVSHDGATYLTLETIALDTGSGDSDVEFKANSDFWPYVRANLSAVTGNLATGVGAQVTVTMAVGF